ncbi:MAG: MATE family efflux transporter, partial [Firmicutes bacterium]|nr:MATE family efflux transporter [Bacillota bacterium]
MSFRSRFIGDKKFYMLVLSIALPMMIQNGITQLVNLLDNIMVGQVGTLQMSGVAIANQLIFVFNLAIFGGISGAGIFGAQFYGSGDYEGLRHAFRYKLYIGAFALISCGSLFLLFSEEMLMLFLHDTNGTSAADIAATLGYAQEYLYLMMIGLVPYTLAQCYA